MDPIAAVTLSLLGHVRRVVMGTSSTVIDLGRRSRLFTGTSREAIFLRGRRCIWPGCGLPHTQIDHLTPWSEGGATSPPNGAPLCPRHNRLKNEGYTTTRRADGSIEVRRPDGEAIVPV
jgi:5-methylcytosine-specific restriction endonuclease McrA